MTEKAAGLLFRSPDVSKLFIRPSQGSSNPAVGVLRVSVFPSYKFSDDSILAYTHKEKSFHSNEENNDAYY